MEVIILGGWDITHLEPEILKNFKVNPTNFIRKKETNIRDTYKILSPPLGRGNRETQIYSSDRCLWGGAKSNTQANWC